MDVQDCTAVGCKASALLISLSTPLHSVHFGALSIICMILAEPRSAFLPDHSLWWWWRVMQPSHLVSLLVICGLVAIRVVVHLLVSTAT
jgi:hypothetical protein